MCHDGPSCPHNICTSHRQRIRMRCNGVHCTQCMTVKASHCTISDGHILWFAYRHRCAPRLPSKYAKSKSWRRVHKEYVPNKGPHASTTTRTRTSYMKCTSMLPRLNLRQLIINHLHNTDHHGPSYEHHIASHRALLILHSCFCNTLVGDGGVWYRSISAPLCMYLSMHCTRTVHWCTTEQARTPIHVI